MGSHNIVVLGNSLPLMQMQLLAVGQPLKITIKMAMHDCCSCFEWNSYGKDELNLVTCGNQVDIPAMESLGIQMMTQAPWQDLEF